MSEQQKANQRAANIKKYGSHEAWKAHMAEIGSKGGKISKRRLTHEEAAAMGKLNLGKKR